MNLNAQSHYYFGRYTVRLFALLARLIAMHVREHFKDYIHIAYIQYVLRGQLVTGHRKNWKLHIILPVVYLCFLKGISGCLCL